MITCACGCGTRIEPFDNRNRHKKYAWGHGNMKTLNNYKFKKGQKAVGIPYKKGNVPWNKGKEWPEMTGENNPAWKGGVTKPRGPRWTKEYRRWRNAVLRRDNYICTWCGATREETIIQTDHIKPFMQYPELRYEVSNGRTLCWPCHKKTKTYSRGYD